MENGMRTLLSELPRKPGVYRIRVLHDDEQGEPINRVDGADSDGILHIGKATDLHSRARLFQGAAIGGKHPHQGGWNFSNYRYSRRFPLRRLAVDWRVMPNERKARELEHQLHEDYQFRFLDRPPLDAQG
jgi:excinuclease UvrABC nuclease subunit